jgi:hypothetical protein
MGLDLEGLRHVAKNCLWTPDPERLEVRRSFAGEVKVSFTYCYGVGKNVAVTIFHAQSSRTLTQMCGMVDVVHCFHSHFQNNRGCM